MRIETIYLDGIEMVVDYDENGILVERRWWPRIDTYSLAIINNNKLVVSALREDRIVEKENPYYQPIDVVICQREISQHELVEYHRSTHLLARKLASLPLDFYWFFYRSCRSLIDAIQFIDEIYWKRMLERSRPTDL
jgi:hypothetical protein